MKMLHMKRNVSVFLVAGMMWCAGYGFAADPKDGPASGSTGLPQKHEYQRVLRRFMASLSEKDLSHGAGVMDESKPYSQDPEYLYRNYLLTLMQQPLVGTKRGIPAVSAPAACFLLSNIERPDGVYMPPVWPEALMSLVQFDFPGNTYKDNRALKLRSFVGAAVQLMMFHDFAENSAGKSPSPVRPDWHGYNPVIWAAPYPGFKDALPPDIRTAYEAGLKAAGERIIAWGIRGESCENDLLAPLGLVYISRALGDPEFTKRVEEYAKPVFTDARFFSPAGYWMERGGPDTGFGGTANLYAAWIALMTDWPFAREALERVYRLRGHLILPEPDGSATGPSHFNSRLGSSALADQYAWDGARDAAAAMVTDEAAQFIRMPPPGELQTAPLNRAHMFAGQVSENLRDSTGHYYTRDELTIQNTMFRWQLKMWMTFNFPISQNPAYEFYRPGAYARRMELEKAKSPLLQSPFLRGGTFVRDFNREFVVTRQPGFAAVLHAGLVGRQTPADNKAQFGGPLGLGGGQLSAFWTPETGSVILGRRSGMNYDKSMDVLEAWRTWPVHAVMGSTAGGKVFTSGRNATPDVTADVKEDGATLEVRGPLVAMKLLKNDDQERHRDHLYDDTLDGQVQYRRAFKLDGKGVRVETTVSGDGKEAIAELYEVLPVYLRDTEKQAKAQPTVIEFQSGGVWKPATAEYAEGVTAVKLTRFNGAVRVAFDQPRRVKLSPADWQDGYLSRAACRNILVDLLGGGKKVAEPVSVSYRVEPMR
jgi:hypothetical protein